MTVITSFLQCYFFPLNISSHFFLLFPLLNIIYVKALLKKFYYTLPAIQ